MEWIERLNGTINYIEENLTEDISLEEIAKIACCSAYHYQRMFGYLAEMPSPSISESGKCPGPPLT